MLNTVIVTSVQRQNSELPSSLRIVLETRSALKYKRGVENRQTFHLRFISTPVRSRFASLNVFTDLLPNYSTGINNLYRLLSIFSFALFLLTVSF